MKSINRLKTADQSVLYALTKDVFNELLQFNKRKSLLNPRRGLYSMMNPTLSQVLLENKNYFPRLKQEFKDSFSNIKLKKKRVFVYFLKALLRHGDSFFESYETIASETNTSSKTVARFIRWMNHHGYIRIQSLHGINQTNNYYIRPKGLKFLMTMRYEFQEYWYLFTDVLMKFGNTAKSLWNSLFLKKCPPINKSKALNTSLDIGINKRERSATCCLIGCKDKACTLPKERAVMEIERLRRGESGVPSHIQLVQNHAASNSTTHQRGNTHYVPGSVRTRPPVNTYVEYKGPEDIVAEKEKANQEYVKMDDKRKFWAKLAAPLISRNEQFKKEPQ